MPNLLSPGVYIEEVDASAIVPNVSANVAFLAGNFSDGPIEQPYVVTTKKEYESIFGTPTDENYNEWFQGYKFFDYANQLVISRAFEAPATDLTTPTDSRVEVYTSVGDLITGGTNVGGEAGYQVSAIIDTPFNYEIRVGDFIEFDNSNVLCKVWKITPIDDTLNSSEISGITGDGTEATITTTSAHGFSVGSQITVTSVDPSTYNGTYIVSEVIDTLNFKITTTNTDAYVSGGITYLTVPNGVVKTQIDTEMVEVTDYSGYSNSVIYLHSDSHLNGETQAYLRGSVSSDIPDNAYASLISTNVDVTDIALNGTSEILNENRLNYTYELIKNSGDFDYKLEQDELSNFLNNMKLKFISRYANTQTIEIAIANSYDFKTFGANNDNYAIAFEEVNGTTKTYTYLTSLFDYSPLEDEVAIAIKKGSDIETFTVSLDPNSVDGNGKNNYIETVINENSKYVYVVDNKSIDDMPASYLVTDRFGYADNTGTTLATNGTPTTVLTIKGGRSPMVSEGGMRDAYFTVEDKERYEIDVVIGNEQFTNVATELAEARKDCIAYIGSKYDIVGKKAIDATNTIITYFKSGVLTRSMFAAYFANYFRIYDKYNKKYRWINVAGDMAGIRCDVTSNTAPWWVSAGMKRGIVRNINKLAFTPSQAQRDNLYKTGANPIVSFPGTGNLVWGNKTLHPIASSFDRINVRTLFNTIERAMAKAARSQIFEFNDPYTRNAIMSMFNPYLSTIKAGRGITDYLVVCDETNNTPDVISRNELKVDIYIKPNYAAEMILLTFTNVGTRSFSDVVGI